MYKNSRNLEDYKNSIKQKIVGNPKERQLGIQDDWWTEITPDMEKSHGSYLHDLCSGRDVLDLMTFFATSPLSYNHPKIINDDFLKELGSVALHKPSNSDFWTPMQAEFIETFRRSMGKSGEYLPHLFLVSGGSLAVENALKAAFDWKVKRNLDFENLSPEKIEELAEAKRMVGDKIICFQEAFHGRSGYTLSLTHTSDRRKYMFFPKFADWPRISNPKIIHPLEEHLDKVEAAEQKSLDELIQCIKNDKDGSRAFAAIIIEPIQGEGGDNHFRPQFFEELRKIADENQILLIYDEVQTGLGLTGKMWCYEHFGENAKPDIISFGKKFQICGVMANRKVGSLKYNVFSSDADSSGCEWGKSRLNSTFGGNLVDMVRCRKYLEIIAEENLCENAAEMGAYFMQELNSLGENHKDLISNIRGRGLMIAFDLKDYKNKDAGSMRDEMRNFMKDNGLFVLATGDKGIRFRPHLDITRDEIDTGIQLLDKSFYDLRNK